MPALQLIGFAVGGEAGARLALELGPTQRPAPGCKADAECNAAYSDLEKRFYSLVERLDAKPVLVDFKDAKTEATTKLLLDGNDVVNRVYDALEAGYKLASLPSLIIRAEQGDSQALKTLAKTKMDVSSFAWGMPY